MGRYRVSIDIGGTFTDFVVHDQDAGRAFTGKVLSTPHNPAEGVITGLRQLIAEPDEIDFIVHGTTVGLNAFLQRRGTRVLDNLAELEGFQRPPWNSGCLQGLVDAAYLNLTPGTRLGVIHDQALQQLLDELGPVEAELTRAIDDQRQAAEEQTSRDVLRSIQSALKEALLALPEEEYDWFELRKKGDGRRRSPRSPPQARRTSCVSWPAWREATSSSAPGSRRRRATCRRRPVR